MQSTSPAPDASAAAASAGASASEELLASQLDEQAALGDAEEPFDAQATLDDVQSRNPHCAVVALLPREGCEEPLTLTTSPPGLEVADGAIAQLSAAFFSGEDAGTIKVCGRELRVVERIEDGFHFLVALKAPDGGEGGAGGYAECTQRGVLLVLYDAGMDAKIAQKLSTGLHEYLVEECSV